LSGVQSQRRAPGPQLRELGLKGFDGTDHSHFNVLQYLVHIASLGPTHEPTP
jgi:hypothetical protein